ncbi:hypothetical protein Q4561_04545 [Alteromonas sp. 1_MG-2023]|uniref:RIFT barrel domain-containing protein n=1 Tax=Alteromonas sp. 1_MG-2023 TaxID=3062669 RepID=UPI0026E20316|nr:hypothetical protein [Alteromonas sp. 1_MG-2023]MDO6566315.1 hypothetical protein [Alteromonas sp. 1_MG-2023]
MTQTVFSIHFPKNNQASVGHFVAGIPCPKGKWPATAPLKLQRDANNIENTTIRTTSLWPDGTIKWLHVEGLVERPFASDDKNNEFAANMDVRLTLAEHSPNTLTNPVLEDKNKLLITTQNDKCIEVDGKQLLTFHETSLGDTQFYLLEKDMSHCHIQSFSYTLEGNHLGYQAVRITQIAHLALADGKDLEVELFATVFLNDGHIKGEVTIKNPNAASHPNGQWDLGDPNSCHIKEFGLAVNATDATISLLVDSKTYSVEPDKTLSIYQASSGHDNWQSVVHVNANNELPFNFKGFKLFTDEQELSNGMQAQPILQFQSKKNTYYLEVNQFWQNFPSSFTANNSESCVSLLGSRYGAPVELQPGEQKTRHFYLAEEAIAQTSIIMCPEWVRSTRTLPFLTDNSASLSKMIQHGVSGASSFFQKRLDIDEFGWRHMGELYADHEKAESPDVEYFVSHYNNQYDPIYGMLCQWIVTGNEKWFELADDLAKHVADIDVYHTNNDKPEYSGGLFWHTDHYVQACTATHRTYSKHQPTGVYDDHAGGGGPGGQHCYTNGLTLHYLMTGYPPSKNAVLSITNWVKNYYEGDGTLLSALLAIKNSAVPGVKNVKTGKYPLDRGTGNYIQALMDRYELLADISDIHWVSDIIKNTISPSDNLAERNFADVENTWFYTVFLQAVCRFISIKESLSQFDEDYNYAVSSLALYTQWMVQNEYAYLDKPDILEFPNQTWSGQDLRKLCVLNFASNYLSNTQAQNALKKAAELEKQISERLSSSSESSTTRLLCLMMQNSNYESYRSAAAPLPSVNKHSTTANAEYNASNSGIFSHLVSHLKTFSVSNERRQFVKRFPQFQKWLGRP